MAKPKQITIVVWEEKDSDVLGSIEDRVWDLLADLGATPILDEQGEQHGLVDIAGVRVAIQDNTDEEPEIVLGCSFRFFGAPMAELEAVASQRRFEKPAVDWQDSHLWEVLDAMPDVEMVEGYENDEGEHEFLHYRLGNVHIEIV